MTSNAINPIILLKTLHTTLFHIEGILYCLTWYCCFSFAQWQYHSQWSKSEAWLLLVENYTQYPAVSSWNMERNLQFLKSPMGGEYLNDEFVWLITCWTYKIHGHKHGLFILFYGFKKKIHLHNYVKWFEMRKIFSMYILQFHYSSINTFKWLMTRNKIVPFILM